MNYEILDSVRIKRTRIELWKDDLLFSVAKIVGKRITFLYHSRQYDLANNFYENTIGIK